MSAAEMPLSIDLNIDRMRAVITKEMAEACKPFMKRLEQLDHVEAFLKVEQQALAAKGRDSAREVAVKKNQARRQARIVKATKPSQKALASGAPTGIYAHVTQGSAILDIVMKEPGLNPHEISSRMVAGGYPFKGTKPVDAMYVALRHQVQVGHIRQVEPSALEREQGRLLSYYPVSGGVVKPAYYRQTHGELTGSIITVLADGPTSGMTRTEVLQALLSSGFHFGPGTENPPERRISWALQSLVDSQRVQKTGMGAGALFSRPKLTAFKK